MQPLASQDVKGIGRVAAFNENSGAVSECGM
jgi:hypothetical protein